MAKKTRDVAYLISTAGTGYFYTIAKKRKAEKLELMKYDPIVRKHVMFKEHAKLKATKE
jgi:large subunit ribosomal protein L33